MPWGNSPWHLHRTWRKTCPFRLPHFDFCGNGDDSRMLNVSMNWVKVSGWTGAHSYQLLRVRRLQPGRVIACCMRCCLFWRGLLVYSCQEQPHREQPHAASVWLRPRLSDTGHWVSAGVLLQETSGCLSAGISPLVSTKEGQGRVLGVGVVEEVMAGERQEVIWR